MLAIPDDIFERCQDPQEVLFILYIAAHADEGGTANLSVRGVAKAINIDRNKAQKLAQKLAQKSTLKSSGKANKTALTLYSKDIFHFEKSQLESQLSDDKNDFEKIWKFYRRDGSKGDKTSAYKNYERLSRKDKENMAKYLPYYMAFTLPKFRPMMPKFIKGKTWQAPCEFNGRPIPVMGYHIADIGKFKKWFNDLVEGTDIPKILDVSEERRVNLNICCTLYPNMIKKAMDVVLTEDKYLELAKKGWLTFDYIFDPNRIIKICEL